MGKSNKQIQNINNKKSVNNWKLTDQMLERMNKEIKSCVLHNLLKADFVSHTFTMVLWDSWTSASQDKMIKQHEEEALKVMLYELVNASFSLFDTKWMNKNLTLRVLSGKVLFHEWGTMKLYVTSNWNIVSEITFVHRLWLNNKIIK